MNKNLDRTNIKITDSVTCGECGSVNIETSWQDYSFPYGVGEEGAQLKCKVPMKVCKECGFSFIDGDAENYCQEEICRYLGVMPPSQIKSLRDFHKMTQSQFSAITKLGEATLSRWERGIVVQNHAYDNYLYLLGFNENMDRLRDRIKRKSVTNDQFLVKQPTFRNLDVTDELKKRQMEFELQPISSES